jgi:hypothetical protein
MDQPQRHRGTEFRDLNRITHKRLGLLINFNTELLKDGIIRRAL